MLEEQRKVVESVRLGGRTAEDEKENLSSYFVETEQWRKVWNDEVDIVFAPKGGGKSAIYNMLMQRESALFDRGVILVPGENPSGATAFEAIQSDDSLTQSEMEYLWQLYFLVLLVDCLEDYSIKGKELQEIRQVLASAGLTPGVKQKRKLVSRVFQAIKRVLYPQSVEAMATVDPTTGISGVSVKLSFEETNIDQEAAGVVFVRDLFDRINDVLDHQDVTAWIVLDRLDVAFSQSPRLEGISLRALFRVYKLLEPQTNIRLKIFLRNDIWQEVTEGGFRETSHFTRDMEIQWDRSNLLKLIVNRLAQSNMLLEFLGLPSGWRVDTEDGQKELFSRAFPRQIDTGENKPLTFDWAISRTSDGKGSAAPRELIHLFSEVRDIQLDRMSTGAAQLEKGSLFESQTFREAQPRVSEARLLKTLYPEYPWLHDWLEDLRESRTLQDLESLSMIWGVDEDEAGLRIRRLVNIGFFETRGTANHRTYWVPFLYRPSLNLVQGTAEGVKDRG